VNERGEFSSQPAATGFRYFMRRSLREQLRLEIDAQFEKFRATACLSIMSTAISISICIQRSFACSWKRRTNPASGGCG